MRDAVEAAAEGAREGFTEASKSRENQDDIGQEKRADDCDKEKQRNRDKYIWSGIDEANRKREEDHEEVKIQG